MANLSMADLLAKQKSPLKVTRNQEIEGEVVTITDSEVILDLGTKSEAVLNKKDLTPDQVANLRVGDKLVVFVLTPENDSGQVVVTMQRTISKGTSGERWQRFQQALDSKQILSGKALEVNKGGLIVEVSGIRGFLPSSQVALSAAKNLDELVGKELQVTAIEVEPNQNRLIFSQKVTITDDIKESLGKLKVGDKVKGAVAAVLPFGIFATLEDPSTGSTTLTTGSLGTSKIEGLVHSSELSWERVEDPGTFYKVGQEVEAVVISVDQSSARVNLSIKQLTPDPFKEKAKEYKSDDVVKGIVTKVNNMGVFLELEDGLEGLIPSSKMEPDVSYEIGQSVTCLVDSVEETKRRISLAPFITTTKGLIYK